MGGAHKPPYQPVHLACLSSRISMGGSQSASKRKESEDYQEDEIEENEHHVEIGDQNAIKNLLDDTLAEFFQEHKDYSVHYGWDNAKLVLMVLATVVAAASQFYRTPAISERALIYTCVIGFFAFHALLLAYTVFVERDIVVRLSKAGQSSAEVLVKTNFPYTEDKYSVEIQFNSEPTRLLKEEYYIGKFFDAEGYFDKESFLKQIEALLGRFEKQKAH